MRHEPAPSAPVITTPQEERPEPVSAELLDQAARALATEQSNVGDNLVASGPARPTVVSDGAMTRTMVVHDQSNMSLPSGRYTLTVFCSGKGSVISAITLDGVTALGGAQPCGAAGASADEIVMKQEGPASQLDVNVIPVGETEAAVTYVVSRQ